MAFRYASEPCFAVTKALVRLVDAHERGVASLAAAKSPPRREAAVATARKLQRALMQSPRPMLARLRRLRHPAEHMEAVGGGPLMIGSSVTVDGSWSAAAAPPPPPPTRHAKIEALEAASCELGEALRLLTASEERYAAATTPQRPRPPHHMAAAIREEASRTRVACMRRAATARAQLEPLQKRLLLLCATSTPESAARATDAKGLTLWDGKRRLSRLPLHPQFWVEAVFRDWQQLTPAATQARQLRAGVGSTPSAATWHRVRVLRRHLRSLDKQVNDSHGADHDTAWDEHGGFGSGSLDDAEAPDQLPAGWRAIWHEEAGRYYYVTAEGETTWESPIDGVAASREEALPEGWREVYDPASRRAYYVDEARPEKTTWVRPTAQRLRLEKLLLAWRDVARRRRAARKDAETAYVLPPGWQENYDKKSKRWFYVHEDTVRACCLASARVFSEPLHAPPPQRQKYPRSSATHTHSLPASRLRSHILLRDSHARSSSASRLLLALLAGRSDVGAPEADRPGDGGRRGVAYEECGGGSDGGQGTRAPAQASQGEGGGGGCRVRGGRGGAGGGGESAGGGGGGGRGGGRGGDGGRHGGGDQGQSGGGC